MTCRQARMGGDVQLLCRLTVKCCLQPLSRHKLPAQGSTAWAAQFLVLSRSLSMVLIVSMPEVRLSLNRS